MRDERQPARRYSRWQTLRFGLPLALLELGVLTLFYTNYEIVSPLRAVLLVLLLYLVVSAFAGYWFCRHRGRHGAWAGLRAGLASAITVMIVMLPVFAFLYLRFVNFLRSCHLHACGPFGPADYLSILVSFFFSLVAINGGGVLLSVLGGWLGGVIAHWRPEARAHPGEQRV